MDFILIFSPKETGSVSMYAGKFQSEASIDHARSDFQSGIKQDGQDGQDKQEKALLLHCFSLILAILTIRLISFLASHLVSVS
jgi:hypothetical protein